MRVALVFFFAFCVSACALFQPTPKKRAEDPAGLAAVDRIQKQIDAGQDEKALEAAWAFVKDNPETLYRQALRLEEGRALENLDRASEADALYRDVRERTMNMEPEIAARAEWRLSFTAEAQGDDSRALAHLMGAARQRDFLPEAVARVEIPARRAVLLHRLGLEVEAEESVKTAERGLQGLLSGPRPKPDDAWMARLYLEMGRSLAGPVDGGNFLRVLKAQRLSQGYLLKTLALRESVTSEKAARLLVTNYVDLWNAILNVPMGPGRRERQVGMIGDLLKVLDEAQLQRPLDGQGSEWEKGFFKFTDDLSRKAADVVYAPGEMTELTEESKLLNDIRRIPGRPEAPAAPAPEPAKDPNL